jgi:hypothetical protein
MSNDQYDAFAFGFSRWTDPRGSAPVTPEARAASLAADHEWMSDTLSRYLAIEPGQIEYADQDVTDGAQLLKMYGGRADVISQALLCIQCENTVRESQKKTYRSALDSFVGFGNVPPTADSGTAPEPAALTASVNSSASAAAATVPSAAPSSGTMASSF